MGAVLTQLILFHESKCKTETRIKYMGIKMKTETEKKAQRKILVVSNFDVLGMNY